MERDRDVNEYYECFPYMSYEEILDLKRRRRRMRKSIIAGLGMTFLFILVITAVGARLVGRTFVSLFVTEYTPDEKVSVIENPPSVTGGELSQALVIDLEPEGEESVLVVVKDVSAMVKVARKSVVGVNCEQYASFTQTSSGSGIILSADGYIVTNYHVISSGDSISVTLDDGTAYPAFLVGADTFTDLAVLRIDAPGLQPASFGDSDLVEAGQPAIAIGNPTGMLTGTVTAGIISAVNRNIMINNTTMSLIQTDASINSGNSGGPLLNQYGQVIGVTSTKISTSGYEGLGFAIPINTVKPIVEELAAKGYVSGRPLVGVYGQEISRIASMFNNIPQGIIITDISADSDAYEQGIRINDIILSVNDERITTLSRACELRNSFRSGDTITLGIYRSGKQYTVAVRLMEQNQDTDNYNY